MDMTLYFQKLHEIEASLPAGCAVVVSLATPQGGQAGVPAEVLTRVAARLIHDGLARAATPAEAESFRRDQQQARRRIEEALALSRVQFTVVPASELPNLRKAD